MQERSTGNHHTYAALGDRRRFVYERSEATATDFNLQTAEVILICSWSLSGEETAGNYSKEFNMLLRREKTQRLAVQSTSCFSKKETFWSAIPTSTLLHGPAAVLHPCACPVERRDNQRALLHPQKACGAQHRARSRAYIA